jgi:acetate CoA/acetoacetate CoA-transferase beta subunit
MDAQELIARRVAQEIRPGTLVNLGIGLPTQVAHYLPRGTDVYLQAENGIIGLGARPPEGMEDPDLTDAGGAFVTAIPGAARIDSALSFGLIRGGHLDMTVLGGLQVDAFGRLANWMVPGKLAPGMGGAMDLVTGARRVVVAMFHTAKGAPKIVQRIELPLTSTRRVDLIVTEMAVIEPTDEGLVLRETAPNVDVDTVLRATAARLIVAAPMGQMLASA